MRLASGLTLKPAKCILIPLACTCSGANVGRIRAWLRENIPGWADFNICDMGKYLGIFVGPKAGDNNWAAPIAKFMTRTKEVAAERLPFELAASRSASRAVSVMQYVAQFVPPS